MKIIDNNEVINLDNFDKIGIRYVTGLSCTQIYAKKCDGSKSETTLMFSNDKKKAEELYEKIRKAWVEERKSFDLRDEY